jgi:hypothetical protein
MVQYTTKIQVENYDILTNFLQIQVFQHDTILKNMLLFFQENYGVL